MFEPPQGARDRFEMERHHLKVVVQRSGTTLWQLTLSTGQRRVEAVHFPWEVHRTPLDDSPADDVIYYPRLLGVAVRMDRMREWAWEGLSYPGPLFAPLVVVADDDDARIVAAANWPPRAVDVHYSLDRLTLRYTEPLSAPATRTFGAIIAAVRQDREKGGKGEKGEKGEKGRVPWHLAADQYKSWLATHRAGMNWPAVPPEVVTAHEWINVQLENQPRFDPQQIACVWERWRKHFPWMQFWGQMSNYAGPPHLAQPPLRPGERVGCCLDSPELHPRYQPGLPALIQRIRRDGGRVGLYSRPRDGYRTLDDPQDSRGDRAFLLDWIRRNRQLGANAAYIDVLGMRDFGQALRIAALVRDIERLTAQTPSGDRPNADASLPVVIEGAVDVNPAPALVSGCLSGGDIGGGPGRSLSHADRITFPRFGRYLLDDRILFLGQSNGDHRFWGPASAYWTERQAFLLGAKLDAMNLTEGDPCSGRPNWAVARIIELRDQVGWWQRGCVYLDQAGLSDIPPGVHVRLFRDSRRSELLVIDNWSQVKGSVRLRGNEVPLPPERLAIIDRGPLPPP